MILTSEDTRKIARTIARTWIDPTLKADFLANPKCILSKLGINVSGYEVITTSDNSANCTSQDGAKLFINLPDNPSYMEDDPLDLNIDNGSALFSYHLCSTCVEIDPKLQLEA